MPAAVLLPSATKFDRTVNAAASVPFGKEVSMEKMAMSVREMSLRMGISLPKAYELVKEPGFPTIRVGTRIIIPTEPFKEWLAAESNRENKQQGE